MGQANTVGPTLIEGSFFYFYDTFHKVSITKLLMQNLRLKLNHIAEY